MASSEPTTTRVSDVCRIRRAAARSVESAPSGTVSGSHVQWEKPPENAESSVRWASPSCGSQLSSSGSERQLQRFEMSIVSMAAPPPFSLSYQPLSQIATNDPICQRRKSFPEITLPVTSGKKYDRLSLRKEEALWNP